MDKYIPFILIPVMGWGVWRHLKSKNDLTPVKKATFAIGITSFLVTEIGRSFYRPFIYENNLYDFHLADTVGNTFGTVAAIFMILTMAGSGNRKDWKLMAMVVAGLMIYELSNFNGFDPWDMVATAIFGAISAVIYFIIIIKYQDIKNLK